MATKVTKNSGKATTTVTPAAQQDNKPQSKEATAKAQKAPVKAKPAAKKGTSPKKKAGRPAAKQKAVQPRKVAKTAVSKRKTTSAKPKAAPKTTVKTTTKPNKTRTMTPEEKIMTTAKTQIDQFIQEASNANKESWDTFMKAGNTFMKGFEEIMKTSMAQAQKAAEKNSQNVKKLMACKTVNEYTELQTKTAQENFDEMMNGMTKLSELSVKVAGDCFAPVNDQFSKTIKKASEAVAA